MNTKLKQLIDLLLMIGFLPIVVALVFFGYGKETVAFLILLPLCLVLLATVGILKGDL